MELNPFELEVCNELPREEPDHGYFSYSYKQIVESITDKVAWFIESGFKDYQGEFFYLGKDIRGNIYYLAGGYGSCSVCDALQACETYEEVLELRDDLKRKIRKFYSLKEFELWFNTEASGEWYSEDDIKNFIDDVKEKLSIELIWRQEDDED